MNIKNTFLTILAGVIVTISADAQTKFYLDGLGRAVVEHDALDAEDGILASDTVGNVSQSTKRSTNGYALFDLGVNLEKGDKFRAKADLRVRNEFGLFYGEGASLEFRRMLLEGIIGKGIKYELGDIDVKMTPFTVWNNGFMDSEFEADVFKIRRDVLSYENFNNGNNWRLQGAQTYGKVLFGSVIESVAFKGFASRTNKTDFNITPDKILAGANVTVDQGKFAKIGVNYTGALDIPLSSTTVSYSNNVFSFTPEVGVDVGENLRIGVLAEYAFSNSAYEFTDSVAISPDTVGVLSYDYNGSALDAKLQVEVKSLKLKFNAGFRNVTKGFQAPGAQSRRIDYQATNRTADKFHTYYLLDTSVVDGVTGDPLAVPTSREINLYDRLTQESVYNQSIYASLMSYNPIYGNSNPYGVATPNRTGFYVELEHGDDESPFKAKVAFNSMSEIESLNNIDHRNYTAIGAGLIADFKKLFDMKKEANIVFGYNMETTSREGDAAGNSTVSLNSSLIDAGLTVEVANNLDLIGGVKLFTAEGNEMIYNYVDLGDNYTLNEVETVIGSVDYSVSESIISAGLRARFDENSFVTLNYNMVSFADSAQDAFVDMKYATSQWYINYTIKF